MKPPKRLFRARPAPDRPGPSRTPDGPPGPIRPDLSRFCVLVPFIDHILHPVERALDELEDQGVVVCRRAGCSAIDYTRSAMASRAMLDGYEAMLFVDSDTLFNPADAIYILRRPEPIVAGVYAQKKHGTLNLRTLPGTTEIAYGDQGRDYEVEGVGAGFLRIRTDALMKIADSHGLPNCDAEGGLLLPFFLPRIVRYADGPYAYEGEDIAFCGRAREAGLKIIADTRITLSHLGLYPYGFREASIPKDVRPRGGVIPITFPEDETDRSRS